MTGTGTQTQTLTQTQTQTQTQTWTTGVTTIALHVLRTGELIKIIIILVKFWKIYRQICNKGLDIRHLLLT